MANNVQLFLLQNSKCSKETGHTYINVLLNTPEHPGTGVAEPIRFRSAPEPGSGSGADFVSQSRCKTLFSLYRLVKYCNTANDRFIILFPA